MLDSMGNQDENSGADIRKFMGQEEEEKSAPKIQPYATSKPEYYISPMEIEKI